MEGVQEAELRRKRGKGGAGEERVEGKGGKFRSDSSLQTSVPIRRSAGQCQWPRGPALMAKDRP